MTTYLSQNSQVPLPSGYNPGRIADEIFIYAESDFPTPVGGIIQLENKAYVIVGNVSITNSLRFPSTGGCALRANVLVESKLSHTGAGALFDTLAMTSAIVGIDRLTFSSTNALFNINGSASALLFFFQNVIDNVASLGSVANISMTVKTNSISAFGQGFALDSIAGLTFSENKMFGGLNQAGTYFLDFQGNHKEIQVSDNFISTNGVNETIFRIAPTSTTTGAVSVGNDFVISAGGTVFDPAGKNQSDPFWKFSGNSGAPASASTAGSNLTVPQTVTITVAGTYVRIDDGSTGGTNIWNLLDEERFSLNASTGEITYIGREDISVQATSTATLEKVGGGTDVISIAFAINGVIQTYSEAQTENTLPTAVTSLARLSLSNGDIVSLWTRNQTGTADVLISQMAVSIID